VLLKDTASLRVFLPLAYVVGALILVDQGLSIFVLLGPPDLSVPAWRFQAATLLAGRVAPFLLADAAILVSAFGLGHQSFARLWGGLHLLLALGLLGSIVLVLRDGAAIAFQVPGERTHAFLALRLRSIGEALVAIPLLAFLAGRAVRTAEGKTDRLTKGQADGRAGGNSRVGLTPTQPPASLYGFRGMGALATLR